ncbi:hypothetical protein Q1695_011885 [Nippostrongylus brasiliensis]|nr:hypothetical protein Q1695_011885 [Nippostrongylus brasiliensis]
MDRLSPISTDSGFESCCCPSSPATSSSIRKFGPSTCVSSLPSSSTALISSVLDARARVICDLTPSSSEISLCREDSISLDSLSTSSRNNDCSSNCAASTSSDSRSVDLSEDHNYLNEPGFVDGGSVRYHCLWSGCSNIYEKADDLYDHVTELHINVLRELSYPCSSSKQESDDDEPIKCHWDDCTMFLRRGDQEKKICWLMNHYRTRHARAANPFHCVIEGCQMRFSTTHRLEEHVPKDTPVVVKKESCYGWRPRVYYPVRPRPTLYCPHFDERLLKCVRLMNKYNFKVAFNPIDFHSELKGAKRRKQHHRYAYKIVPSDQAAPSPLRQPESRNCTSLFDIESMKEVTIFDLFPPVDGFGSIKQEHPDNAA